MNAAFIRWQYLALIAALACVVILVLLHLRLGPFESSAMCNRCGAMRSCTEWQIPYSYITLFRRSAEEPTPVSACLTTNHLVPPHEHQWILSWAEGNGRLNEEYGGENIANTAMQEEVGELIALLHRYDERSLRDQVLSNLFNDDTTYAVRMLAWYKPPATNAAHLREWVVQNRPYIDDAEAEAKENRAGKASADTSLSHSPVPRVGD